MLLDPHGQAEVVRFGRRRQQQRNGFSQVAYRLVTLVEQPFGQAGCCLREPTQQLGRHQLARLATRQKVDGPRGVLWRRSLQIAL